MEKIFFKGTAPLPSAQEITQNVYFNVKLLYFIFFIFSKNKIKTKKTKQNKLTSYI